MPYLFIGFAVTAFTVFSVLRNKKGSYAALAFKIVSSCLFIGVSLMCFFNNAQIDIWFFAFILCGQFFSLAGDILLDLKVIKRERIGPYLYSGMSCFSLCQVFYITALCGYSQFHAYPLIAALVITPLILLSAYGMKIRLKNAFWNSVIYGFLLCYTVSQSLYMLLVYTDTFSLLFFIGALCFFLSDGVLMLTYFKRMEQRPMIMLNHFLYYVGQFLIAFSLLFIR